MYRTMLIHSTNTKRLPKLLSEYQSFANILNCNLLKNSTVRLKTSISGLDHHHTVSGGSKLLPLSSGFIYILNWSSSRFTSVSQYIGEGHGSLFRTKMLYCWTKTLILDILIDWLISCFVKINLLWSLQIYFCPTNVILKLESTVFKFKLNLAT